MILCRCPEEATGRGGRWANMAMNKSYLTNICIPFIMYMAGCNCPSQYFLPRSTVPPHPELLKLVLPEVVEWQARFAKVSTCMYM